MVGGISTLRCDLLLLSGDIKEPACSLVWRTCSISSRFAAQDVDPLLRARDVRHPQRSVLQEHSAECLAEGARVALLRVPVRASAGRPQGQRDHPGVCCSLGLSCIDGNAERSRSLLALTSCTPCKRLIAAAALAQDIRRIVRNDARIMNKLHRRVFLDKIGMEDLKVYISFYVEASNRDAFMAVKQVGVVVRVPVVCPWSDRLCFVRFGRLCWRCGSLAVHLVLVPVSQCPQSKALGLSSSQSVSTVQGTTTCLK